MGMLQTNPQRRFSIHQVLKQPIIRGRIQQFLSRSGLQAEFAHTVIHGQPSPGQLIVQPPPRPPEAARDPLQARALPAFEAQRARADAALQQQQELAQLKSAAEAARQQEELLRAQARARQQRVRVSTMHRMHATLLFCFFIACMDRRRLEGGVECV
jgi:hypothetical protein